MTGATGATGATGPKGDPTYLRTVLVSPSAANDPTQNGTALITAMTLISNSSPSAANPYLLKVEPGNYYITTALTLKPYVDLEGSGAGTTVISSTLGSGTNPPATATLIAASN